jgi:hypothetical protein
MCLDACVCQLIFFVRSFFCQCVQPRDEKKFKLTQDIDPDRQLSKEAQGIMDTPTILPAITYLFLHSYPLLFLRNDASANGLINGRHSALDMYKIHI